MKKNNILLSLTMIFCFLYTAGVAQTGSYKPLKGIAIYIDYSDHPRPAEMTNTRLDSLVNGTHYQEEGVARTFRSYWREQSRRNIDITHTIFYYRAPQTLAYYNAHTWGDALEMWKGALEWVVVNYPEIDWEALTRVEGWNNELRSVMIISSGTMPGVGGAHEGIWTLSNGVKTRKLHASVLQESWEPTVNLFTAIHEAAHAALEIPDTYDNDGYSLGTGHYSVMSYPDQEVPPLGGPFLVQKNWGYIVEPATGMHTITLRTDGDSVVAFRNPYDPYEYFTIEARKKSTVGNRLLTADRGLLIWHSDIKADGIGNRFSDRTPLQHYQHSLEQADGLFELESPLAEEQGNPGDFYMPGHSFSDHSLPDSKWWDGRVSGLEVKDIQFISTDKIRFTLVIPEPPVRASVISQTSWSLVSAAKALDWYGMYDGEKAFDGNATTYYHVPFGNTEPKPHELVVNLGKTYTVNEFNYTANKDNSGTGGRVKQYELYLSEDGVTWGTPISAGSFFETQLPQYALFPYTDARFIKFSILSTYDDNAQTSVAEINLRGTANAPEAYFKANHTTPAAGDVVVFTDSSSASTSWSWQFPGGLPATSADRHPSVTYAEAGLYSVTLTVTNANGSDVLTQTHYIQVTSITSITDQANSGPAVYPNPVREGMIHFPEGAIYKVYNSYGQLLLQGLATSEPVELKGLPAEQLYLMEINYRNKCWMEKVLVK